MSTSYKYLIKLIQLYYEDFTNSQKKKLRIKILNQEYFFKLQS
jgi:hypothetical protein